MPQLAFATHRSYASSPQGSVKNRPFDEAMDLSESESSVETNPSPRPGDVAAKKSKVPAKAEPSDESSSEEEQYHLRSGISMATGILDCLEFTCVLESRRP